jgi:hypothetical protein
MDSLVIRRFGNGNRQSLPRGLRGVFAGHRLFFVRSCPKCGMAAVFGFSWSR